MQDADGSVGEAGNTFNKGFGDLVREARGDKQWSQRQLAEVLARAGVRLDPSAITRIERGTRDVKLSEAVAIASVLGIDLGKGLAEIAFSPEQKFGMAVAAVAASAVQARRMLVEALDGMDRMILNGIDDATQKRLSKAAGFSGIAQLYSCLIREEREAESRGMWAQYVGEGDRRAKQAVITAVIDEVLVEGVF